MDTHGTKNQQFPTPHLSYIRDPRYPTVKQWLEHEAATNRQHRQGTGFTISPHESADIADMRRRLSTIPELPTQPYKRPQIGGMFLN